jgi:hypothetical protein
MSINTVTHVRMELSSDLGHEHISKVRTNTGVVSTRREVADSIAAGDYWQTSTQGHTAKIHAIDFCPRNGCMASPYIRTNPNSVTVDNLESLPRF